MTPAEAAAAETARVYGTVSRQWHAEATDITPTTEYMRLERSRVLWALAAEIGQEPIPGIDDTRAVA